MDFPATAWSLTKNRSPGTPLAVQTALCERCYGILLRGFRSNDVARALFKFIQESILCGPIETIRQWMGKRSPQPTRIHGCKKLLHKGEPFLCIVHFIVSKLYLINTKAFAGALVLSPSLWNKLNFLGRRLVRLLRVIWTVSRNQDPYSAILFVCSNHNAGLLIQIFIQ